MTDKLKKPKKQYRVDVPEIEFRNINLGKPIAPRQKYDSVKNGRYVRNSGLVNS